jgi:hypothetical protein
LFFTIRAPFTEVGSPLLPGLTGAETRHATGAFVGLIPALRVLVASPPSSARGFLWNRGSAGAAWAIKILFRTVVHVGIASTEATLHRLRIFKAVVVLIPTAPEPSRARFSAWRGRFIVEVGRTSRLFRRDTPQPNTFVGEKHCGSGQEELAELKNGIKAPALKKQNPAAEESDCSKENVVIPCKRRLERAHEIEQRTADGQHNPDNAGPIKTGINQRCAPACALVYEWRQLLIRACGRGGRSDSPGSKQLWRAQQ